MIRALPAGRSPGAIALGVVGAVFLSVALGGCAGSLDPSVAAAAKTGGGGGGSGGGSGTACTTAQAMAALGTYSCSQASCHSAAIKISGFDMETAGWETHLVGTNPSTMSVSCGGSTMPYLVAGSQPATGLFMGKVNGTQSCGVRMPYGSTTGVAKADVDCIQSWANTLTVGGGGNGGSSGSDAGSTRDSGGGQ